MKKRKNRREFETHDYVIWTIRILLFISILLYMINLVFELTGDNLVTMEEIINITSKKIEQIFWALLTLVLTFLPDYMEKYRNIRIPNILEIAIVMFIYAGLFLSERFDLYLNTFWWDDLLHAISGIIIGFIGFLVIYKINKRHTMDISPLLVATFSFTFSVTLGVLWEIFEFILDAFLGATTQSWDLPNTEILMGKSFQGSGLRDTMSDLIIDSLGALITSVICYFLYKNEKKKALKMMKEIFPD